MAVDVVDHERKSRWERWRERLAEENPGVSPVYQPDGAWKLAVIDQPKFGGCKPEDHPTHDSGYDDWD
jgi:hypothetical protein